MFTTLKQYEDLSESENYACLSCSERLRQEQAVLEERHEKRLELLSQSVLKSRKRKRIVEGEEEFVSSVLLHAEQVKVKVQ